MNLADLALVTYPVLLVIAGFLIKNYVKDFKESVKDFQSTMTAAVKELKMLIERYAEMQRLCQLSLAANYRTKAESEKDWKDLRMEQVENRRAMYTRLDDMNARLIAVEIGCGERHKD